MRKHKVLLISVVDYADSKNGGAIWATNLLETLALVPGIELVVVSIGDPARSAANARVLRDMGLDHVVVPFRPGSSRSNDSPSRRAGTAVLTVLLEKYFFDWELEARRQGHVDAEVGKVIDDQRPDLILIGYFYSALFVPSIFDRRLPVCLVSLNNEAEFHRSLRAFGGPPGQRLRDRMARWMYRRFNLIANRRVEFQEKSVHRRCTGITVLTKNDLPVDVPNHVVTAVLPPLLKRSELRWSYRGTRRLFFVGNIGHYPNRLAIEWISGQFSAALLRFDATIQVNVIGADANQVPAGWRSPNVRFMGYADRPQVIEQMTTADLFIAPIANNFGAKLKLVECIAHGMPFIATAAAMSGLQFLTGVPQIILEQPVKAAQLVADYVASPDALRRLSESVTKQVEQERANQQSTWGSFIKRSIERPVAAATHRD